MIEQLYSAVQEQLMYIQLPCAQRSRKQLQVQTVQLLLLHCCLVGTLLDFVVSHQVCELLCKAVSSSLDPA